MSAALIASDMQPGRTNVQPGHAGSLQDAHPQDILRAAFAAHDRIALSFSGAEDVALIHMARQITERLTVFTLDTGRLHPETYRFIDAVRRRYGIAIDMLCPDPDRLAALVRAKGLFSFYDDGHQECCAIRKIEPLRRYLGGLDAWVTGQRRDQSPTRSALPTLQQDTAFGRPGAPLMKYNPLAEWSSAQIWQYIREGDLPYNPLHDQGYLSIGCEPCTRPVGPGQHERAGRWWWEEATRRECGLHAINTRPAAGH